MAKANLSVRLEWENSVLEWTFKDGELGAISYPDDNSISFYVRVFFSPKNLEFRPSRDHSWKEMCWNKGRKLPVVDCWNWPFWIQESKSNLWWIVEFPFVSPLSQMGGVWCMTFVAMCGSDTVISYVRCMYDFTQMAGVWYMTFVDTVAQIFQSAMFNACSVLCFEFWLFHCDLNALCFEFWFVCIHKLHISCTLGARGFMCAYIMWRLNEFPKLKE